MDATLAVACDYASYSIDEKLNILGVFQRIESPVFPTTIPAMYIVASFSASPAEANSEKEIEFVLLGPDGADLTRVVQAVMVQQSGERGLRSTVNVIVEMQMVQFPAAGDYAISVMVGGEEKRSIPLRLM